MRVSNNIHNVASLDEVEFIQEWTEQEKIPVKASPITVTPPPKKEGEEENSAEEPKADSKPEGEAEKPAEEPKPEVKQPE